MAVSRCCWRCWFLLLLFSVTLEGKSDSDSVSVKNCTASGGGASLYNVVHSNHSCLHIAWGFPDLPNEYPSLFIAHSSTDQCDCRSLFRDSYSEEEVEGDTGKDLPLVEAEFSLGVIFRGIFEYPATKKKLAAEGLNLTHACNAENGTEHDNSTDSDEYLADLSEPEFNYFSFSEVEEWEFFVGNNTFVGRVGNFTRYSIRVGLPSKVGGNRLSYFPKTSFHENSTTFDFISNNYTCIVDNSRLALDLVLVHGTSLKNGSIETKKTVDDEYTPSVFSSYTYLSKGTNNPAKSQVNHTWFLQWKPISYQDAGRKSTSSQQATIVPTGTREDCALDKVPKSLVSQIYNGSHSNITRWFVAFGTSGDDSYFSPTYNTWTVAVGAGTVPADGISIVVLITIIVGFGIPGVLVIFSMVYVVLRKKPWRVVMQWSNRNRGYTKLS